MLFIWTNDNTNNYHYYNNSNYGIVNFVLPLEFFMQFR